MARKRRRLPDRSQHIRKTDLPPAKRPRHPSKELETVIQDAENHGWRAEKPAAYFKLYCPCDEYHWKTVVVTPSGANYEKNLRKWFERQSCWDDGKEAI